MKTIQYIILIKLILSISLLEAQTDSSLYSFFIAGHTYGQPGVNNIGLHPLLWWEPDNIYANIKPNSFAGMVSPINFWTDIEPLFHQLPNQVVFCAGDLEAASWSNDFMYDSYDNIRLMGSGMGEGIGDNFIVINVDFKLFW